jgi:hypothetical protein
VTRSARIGQPSADFLRCRDVAHAVVDARALPLYPCEFTLKELSPTANGAESIAIDDEQRRIRNVNVATTSTDLLC